MSIIQTRGLDKLKQLLINDKHFNPARFNDVLVSDIYKILCNYMDLSREDILSRFDIDSEGNYVFKMKVKCKRLKVIGIINN